MLLNKVGVQNLPLHLLDGEQCKWHFTQPLPPYVRALEDGEWCCLMSPEEYFPSKGACSMLKEMSRILVYLIRGRNILAGCVVVAWYVMAVGRHEMCMFGDWEGEGFGVFLSFFAVELWRPPDCIRQPGLVKE